jgi:two-component system sensor histidine kinase ChvG
MGVILEDVTRLDRLITDISQASRVEAELAQTHRDNVDFSALVDSWVSMMRDRYPDIKLSWKQIDKRQDKTHF